MPVIFAIQSIFTTMQASISPTSISYVGASSNVTTGNLTVSPTGGTTPYTYAWSWQSGGTGITINSPTSITTGFSTSGLSAGTNVSGTVQCLVTDSVGNTATVSAPISITRVSLVNAVASPTTLSVTQATSSETTGNTTVTASGGGAPYSYSWSWQSGGASLNINSPTSPTTNFTGTGMTPGTSRTGVAQCVVTDQYGQTSTPTVSVSTIRVTTVSASVSPTSLSSEGPSTTQTTGNTTVTASGGSGSYSYSWAWFSGGVGLTINSPTAPTTSITGASMTLGNTYSGTAQCSITDTFGQNTTAQVSVSIVCSYLYMGTVTVGQNTPTDTEQGYVVGTFGAITPAIDHDSNMVNSLVYVPSSPYVFLNVVGTLSQSYFANLNINGQTFTSASATYSTSGGMTTWMWDVFMTVPFNVGTVYNWYYQ